MRLSVILPTYEEAGHIVHLIETILQHLKGLSWIKACQVIVVDDSPSSATADVVQQWMQMKDPTGQVHLFHRDRSKGLADAVQFGIEKSDGDALIVMDSDFNHHPHYLPILANLLQYYDFVIGSRYVKGGGMRTSRIRYMGSYIFNSWVRLCLRTQVHDNLSGFFGLRRATYRQLQHRAIFYGYGDYFIRMIHNIGQLGGSLIEIPVIYEERSSGKSKTNLLKVLLTYSRSLLLTRLTWKS